MDALTNNPVLETRNLMKVIDNLVVDSKEFRGMEKVPIVTTNADKVEFDIDVVAGGMTQAVAPGAESPTWEQAGAKTISFTPGHFREKTLLTEKDVTTIRQLGTYEQIQTARNLMTRKAITSRYRTEARVEWCRWQMMQGSLSINNNGIQYTVTYDIPSRFTPTLAGADRWNQTTADPLADLMEWVELFRDVSAMPGEVWINKGMMRLLMNSSVIRAIRDTIYYGPSNDKFMNPGVLKNILTQSIGDMDLVVYDGGVMLTTMLTSQLAAAATSFNVDDASGFESGDVCTIEQEQSQTQEQVTIDSISGNTITLSSGPTNTYRLGSQFRIKKFFIPDNLVFIFGNLPTSARGGTSFAEFVSTNSVYGSGSINDPKPGPFIETQIHNDNADPKRIEIISGINGLPVMYHVDTFVFATTY